MEGETQSRASTLMAAAQMVLWEMMAELSVFLQTCRCTG